ncbi:uncharacterized protein LOC141907835 [Tubulanus polymorphus]|uniref:uncharacterized protein LOC141907835 n=1 Tax=Tubulanus polymorphus TaxID=672921 RepID=UPI003DA38C3B
MLVCSRRSLDMTRITASSVTTPDHIEWPRGTYSLQQPDTGCPSGGVTWENGIRVYERSQKKSNSWASDHRKPHISLLDSVTIKDEFCTKTSADTGSFTEGSVQLSPNVRADAVCNISGTLPSGDYTDCVTKYAQCCRNDPTYNGQELQLPNDKAFFLIPNKECEFCPKIIGMQHTMEYYWYGMETSETHLVAPHGHSSGWVGTRQLYSCYYFPVNDGFNCGFVKNLTLTENVVTFTSPNYAAGAKTYPPGAKCSWTFIAPEDSLIHLEFDDFDLEYGATGCYDWLELRLRSLNQLGRRICGTSPHFARSYLSKGNAMMIRMFTNNRISGRGFAAKVTLISPDKLCYNLADRGVSYRGNVDFTQNYEKCLPWDLMKHCRSNPFAGGALDAGLQGHNYCRNPDGITQPWCYTHAEDCRRDVCDACLIEKCHDRFNDCIRQTSINTNFCQTEPGYIGCHRNCTFCKAPLKAVPCSSPPTSVEADLVAGGGGTSFAVGHVVKYKCKKGNSYVSKMCLSDGTWSGSPVICHGCPDGYTEGGQRCYKAVDTKKTFSDAEDTCKLDGGHLLTFSTIHQRNIAMKLTVDLRMTTPLWIGLRRDTPEAAFQWVTGESAQPSLLYWPKNYPSDKLCVKASKYQYIYDADCDQLNAFVCVTSPLGHSVCSDVMTTAKCEETLNKHPDTCTRFVDYAYTNCRKSCGLCIDSASANVVCQLTATEKGENTVMATSKTEYKIGEEVTTQCQTDHELVEGFNVRVCTAKGFAGSPPKCKKSSEVPRSVGNAVYVRHYKDEAYEIIINGNYRITKVGQLTQWKFYSATESRIALMVFEQLSETDFRLVGQNIVHTYSERTLTIDIPKAEQINVMPGFVVGWHYLENFPAPLRYDKCAPEYTEGNDIIYKREGDKAALNEMAEYAFNPNPNTCREYSIQAHIEPGAINPKCLIEVDASSNATADLVGEVVNGTKVIYTCKNYNRLVSGNLERVCLVGGRLTGLHPKCEYEEPCREGWLSFDEHSDSCFKVVDDETLTKSEAAAECADDVLVTFGRINNFFRNDVLHSRMKPNVEYWTSDTLHKSGSKNFYSTNTKGPEAVFLAKFASGEPSINVNGTCMTVVKLDGDYIRQKTTACTEKKPYICQEGPTEVCPRNYKRFGKKCYKFVVMEQKNYSEASADCRKYGQLAVDSDDTTHEYFRNKMVDFKKKLVDLGLTLDTAWIGLTRNMSDRTQWHWQDNTALSSDDHVYWGSAYNKYQQPWDYSWLAGDCAALQRKYWMGWDWDNIACSTAGAYICEASFPVNQNAVVNVDYRGSLKTTVHGYTCQSWTSNYPHKPWSAVAGLVDGNCCRNPIPEDEAKAWCYTTDYAKRWDFCKVPAVIKDDYCNFPRIHDNTTLAAGEETKDRYELKETLNLECEPGYEVTSGIGSLTCIGGVWLGEVLRCM